MWFMVMAAMAGYSSGQPLTAPDVGTATMRRWNSRTMMTTGTVTTTDAAAIAVVGGANWDSPVKNASAAGTGRARLVEVSEIPKTKSFQQKKNVRIAAVKTPGAASGTMTFRNACQVVAPSTWAACSISHGISRKNADSVQIASGSANEMYGMMSPGQVSNSLTLRHRSNSGPTSDTTGNMAIASAKFRISFLPGKSSRAIAYATKVAKTTPTAVAMSEMPIELISAEVNRSVLKTVW